MAFEVLTPPRDNEPKLIELAREVLNAAVRIGGEPMDVEGFLYSWIGGTRIVVERDDTSQEVIGLGIFTAGQQWPHDRVVAHVLRIDGDVPRIFGFIKTMCQAIGATGVYFEDESDIRMDGDIRVHTVKEYPLR